MNTFKNTFSLFKILFKNSFAKSLRLGNKKGQKIAAGIGLAFGLLILLGYIVGITIFITNSAIDAGFHKQLLYLFIALSQFAVLFLGSFASMSYLYFSKDNFLLSSLPLSNNTLFFAKFFMVYVTEFIINAFFALSTFTTYGVVCISNGIGINAGFFILEFIGLFVFPIIPLLIISILSLPLMYIVSFFKKRNISNAIAISILLIFVLCLYFAMIGSFSTMAGNANEQGIIALSPQFVNMLSNFEKITFFNKPVVEAMLGNKTLINLLIYLAEIIILFSITILLNSLFYKKGVQIILEGQGSIKKKIQKELVYASSSMKKALFIKELKTLVNTPMMLVTSLLGVILGPIMIVFVFKTGMGSSPEINSEFYSIGFVSYIVALMVGATNQVAMVGFSREGKNLLILKSLPISSDALVKVKLYFATCINLVTVIIVGILFYFISPSHNIVSTIGIMLVTLSCGFGTNCIGLLSDLKNPNLKWNNITELTKNNKKSLKPVLIVVGIGLTYLIMGSVLSAIKVEKIWSYLIYFGVCFVVNTILVVLSYKKLFEKPKELLDAVEG